MIDSTYEKFVYESRQEDTKGKLDIFCLAFLSNEIRRAQD